MNVGPFESGVSVRGADDRWRAQLVDVISSSGRTFRIALARHQRLRWLAAAAAGLAAWSFGAVVGEAAMARDAWGDTVEVWVADQPVGPGDPISVESRHYPVAVVPPGALTGPPDAGVVALGRLAPGRIVVGSDVAGLRGPASLAPPGSVVVAIADPLVVGVDPGTTVTIAAEGVTLARSGVVTASADGVVHVAVDAADGPMVAAAAHRHLASLLILAPPGAPQD